jgi:hypothetical protein
MKKFLIVSLFLLGCDEQTKKDWFPPVEDRASHIMYVKDKRTNLCFAYNGVNNGHGFTEDVFTSVPCTPEVERLIK